MTEEEAKTKWCPFARPGAVRPDDCGEVRGNRNMDGSPDGGANCIGSACMAWRWDREGWALEFDQGGMPGPTLARRGQPAQGFCGLAGKP